MYFTFTNNESFQGHSLSPYRLPYLSIYTEIQTFVVKIDLIKFNLDLWSGFNSQFSEAPCFEGDKLPLRMQEFERERERINFVVERIMDSKDN